MRDSAATAAIRLHLYMPRRMQMHRRSIISRKRAENAGELSIVVDDNAMLFRHLRNSSLSWVTKGRSKMHV